MILALRTDSPTVELYLLDAIGQLIGQESWLAERRLATELLTRIQAFLSGQHTGTDRLTGVTVYTGSGSFTGLRIGTAVANALAYSLSIPVATVQGEDWLNNVVTALKDAKPGTYAIPQYAAPPNVS